MSTPTPGRYWGLPNAPLVITEGVKKSDSCWGNFEVVAISLAGVWAWRGTDAATVALLALAAWEDIALADRSLFVGFDSDLMTKRPVLDACSRLGAFLQARHAHVRYVILPNSTTAPRRAWTTSLPAAPSGGTFRPSLSSSCPL